MMMLFYIFEAAFLLCVVYYGYMNISTYGV